MPHPFTHDLRRRLKPCHHARHIRQQSSARAAHDVMHLLDGLPDFTHGVQQHGRMFDAAPGLIRQIIQILTHAAQVGDQRGQIGIHLDRKSTRLNSSHT